MTHAAENVSLLDQAKQLYATHSDRLDNRDIAKKMDVSKEWVRKFLCGDIKNPGVLNVEAFIKAVTELTNV